MAYIVKKAQRFYYQASGELNPTIEPAPAAVLYFVHDNSKNSQTGTVAMCWTQDDAEMIRDALNA